MDDSTAYDSPGNATSPVPDSALAQPPSQTNAKGLDSQGRQFIYGQPINYLASNEILQMCRCLKSLQAQNMSHRAAEVLQSVRL
jgi:hypothetical protein